jgi:hypothetical protein
VTVTETRLLRDDGVAGRAQRSIEERIVRLDLGKPVVSLEELSHMASRGSQSGARKLLRLQPSILSVAALA